MLPGLVLLLAGWVAGDCSDPLLCPTEFALAHRPLLRFDGSAADYCYPDTAANANNNQALL